MHVTSAVTIPKGGKHVVQIHHSRIQSDVWMNLQLSYLIIGVNDIQSHHCVYYLDK